MRQKMPLVALAAACISLLAAIPASADDAPTENSAAKKTMPTDLREASRSLTQRFATQLKDELTRAMVGGGPPAAVKVCAERAPLIAAELSRESGAKIGRTSLSFRNTGNAPEPWQYRVLQAFDEAGADAGTEALEYFETNPGPGTRARYMSAIVTKPLCVACHGEPEGAVKLYLDELYPNDRATGYEAGDIRGAFYVMWPAPARQD